MLGGEEGRGAVGGSSDLGVNMLDVVIGSFDLRSPLVGDLASREPEGENFGGPRPHGR